ncbi:MAG: hypothetical protein LW855_07225 [Alphaproteobacteria bacterium]|jgi:hypothetical protein|nr:hypothetical protein [Alphaproteobacteria bacterium]
MRLELDAGFEASFKKRPKDIIARIAKAVALFQENPLHPSLHFKPSAKRNGAYSIRVTQGYRILLLKKSDDHFILLRCCNHDDYERLF